MRETVVWQHGVRQRVEAEKLPDPLYYGDITDDAVLIGTTRTPSGFPSGALVRHVIRARR